jgi:hypothetical protein
MSQHLHGCNPIQAGSSSQSVYKVISLITLTVICRGDQQGWEKHASSVSRQGKLASHSS